MRSDKRKIDLSPIPFPAKEGGATSRGADSPPLAGEGAGGEVIPSER